MGKSGNILLTKSYFSYNWIKGIIDNDPIKCYVCFALLKIFYTFQGTAYRMSER